MADVQDMGTVKSKYSKHRIVFLAALSLIGGVLFFHLAKQDMSLFVLLKLMACYATVTMAGVHDAIRRTIPNLITLSLIIVWAILSLIEVLCGAASFTDLGVSLASGILSVLFLYIALKLTKGGIGYGDVKLVGAIGLCTGIYFVLIMLLFALLLCAVASLPEIVRKKQTWTKEIPFAPFIYAGYALILTLSLF